MNLYRWQPRDSAIEELDQRFVYFHLDFLDLCGKGSMKMNDLVAHIDNVTGFLTKGSKGLIVIDNIFTFILFKVLLVVYLSDVGII